MILSKIIPGLLLIFSIATVHAQVLTPEKVGLKAVTLSDKNLGEINYYVTSNKINVKKPVLLYLDGSGAYPLFQYTQRGTGSTVPIDLKALSDKFHVVLISKPGVPFADSVKIDPQSGYPDYPAPLKYKQRLSLEWRVGAADRVLSSVLKTLPVDHSKVTVLGVSEGFQVGAKLAATNHAVTHAILMVGNGLTQFYDFLIQNRTDAISGKITQAEAQINIDSLERVFKDIYTHPKATNKEWLGHTYLRWASFARQEPIDNILSLNIPVYIVAAGNDRNTSVLSSDYIKLQAIRLNRNNITYKVYPYDHSFNEYLANEDGKTIGMKNHTMDVITDALIWLATL